MMRDDSVGKVVLIAVALVAAAGACSGDSTAAVAGLASDSSGVPLSDVKFHLIELQEDMLMHHGETVRVEGKDCSRGRIHPIATDTDDYHLAALEVPKACEPTTAYVTMVSYEAYELGMIVIDPDTGRMIAESTGAVPDEDENMAFSYQFDPESPCRDQTRIGGLRASVTHGSFLVTFTPIDEDSISIPGETDVTLPFDIEECPLIARQFIHTSNFPDPAPVSVGALLTEEQRESVLLRPASDRGK